MPSRLIDVGLNKGSEQPRLFVLDRDDSSVLQAAWRPYLTLSHCWGESHVLKLVQANIDELRRSLPVKSLPKTFQDAFEVTRALGYQYLWIDSLCIVQDSEDDWKREAGRMATVYGNSDCTLAALGASSAEGCFKRRNPLFRRPCRLVDTQATSVYAYGFEHTAGSTGLVGGEDDRPDFFLDQMPLLRRAWVLQERMISRRVLYLGSPGMYWECCETKASEFWPEGRPHINIYQENIAVKEILASVLRPDILEDSGDRQSFERIWNWITDTYTASGLTFRTDRTVALSGIATLIQQRTNMTYLGGLWKELMPGALLWSNYKPVAISVESTRSPTWAWLSLDNQVVTKEVRNGLNVKDSRVLETVDILDVNVTYPQDPNHVLGDLKNGCIKMGGLIRQISGPFRYTIEPGGWETSSTFAVDEETGTKFHFSPDIQLSDDMTLYFFLVQSSGYKVKHHPSPPWAEPEDEVQEQGLVLVPRQGVADAFVRIGYFSNIYWAKSPITMFRGPAERRTISIY